VISSSKTSHPAVSVFQIKTDLIDSFRKAGLESATLDARFIIMSVAGLTQGDVIARPDQILPEGVVAKIQHFKNRRLSGEPLDSVLGYSEFTVVVSRFPSMFSAPDPKRNTSLIPRWII